MKGAKQKYGCIKCDWTVETCKNLDGARCTDCGGPIWPSISTSKPRPPLGLTPRWICEEERLEQVRAAIGRYIDASMNVPVEWIEEHNELTARLSSRKMPMLQN